MTFKYNYTIKAWNEFYEREMIWEMDNTDVKSIMAHFEQMIDVWRMQGMVVQITEIVIRHE